MKELLELIKDELPQDTICYAAKVVSIESSGLFKLIHLVDGPIIKSKR